MSENARIDQSVANEILDRTIRYEEQELYRQYDVITSHAGKIDNRTNAIIEYMSDQLADQCTVSIITSREISTESGFKIDSIFFYYL